MPEGNIEVCWRQHPTHLAPRSFLFLYGLVYIFMENINMVRNILQPKATLSLAPPVVPLAAAWPGATLVSLLTACQQTLMSATVLTQTLTELCSSWSL